jgi:hypothetical protein
MRAALVYMGTASGSSAVLPMGDYASNGKNALTLDVLRAFRTGTVTSLLVEHCATAGGTFTTLHDFGNLTDILPRTFYDWEAYLKMTVTYAEDASAEDPGLRAAVGVHVWGPPEWNAVKICRPEHIKALFPAVVDTDNGFESDWPDQADAAKREIELMLRAKQVDPYTIFTDGHSNKPVPEGLETAGAALTIYNLLGSGAAVFGDGMKDARDHFHEVYESQLETWLLGAAQVDKEADGKPDDTDSLSIGLEMRW